MPWHRMPFSGGFQSGVADCSRSIRPPLPSAGEHLVPAHELFTQDSLVLAIRRHSAQVAASGQIAVRAKRKLHVPRSFTRMGPAHRIRLIGSPDVLPREVDRFAKDATQANLLIQVKCYIPGMASDVTPLFAN